MPINTSGFIVSQMPHYTPVDPNLVAFDPSQILGGASQAVQFAQQLAQRKAFLQQQMDESAIRQNKLAAINAQNQGIIDVTGPKSLADIALANQTATLAPGATQVGLARNQGALADLQFNEQLRPVAQDTALVNADAGAELARFKSDNQLPELQSQNDATVAKNQYTAAEYKDKLDSIVKDSELTDSERIAKIRQLNASSTYEEGRNSTSEKNALLRASTHAQLDKSFTNARDTYRAISTDLVKEGSAPATDPTGQNPRFTVAEAADAYNQNPTGFTAALKSAFGIADPKAPIPAGIKAQIDGYNSLRKDAEDARKQMVDLNSQAHKLLTQDQPDSGTPQAITFRMPGVSSSMPQVQDPSQPQNVMTPLGIAQPAPQTGPVSVSSRAQFDALPSGSAFIYNGRAGIKK